MFDVATTYNMRLKLYRHDEEEKDAAPVDVIPAGFCREREGDVGDGRGAQ